MAKKKATKVIQVKAPEKRPTFEVFTKFLYRESRPRLPYPKWKKEGLESLESVYKEFLRDTKKAFEAKKAAIKKKPAKKKTKKKKIAQKKTVQKKVKK